MEFSYMSCRDFRPPTHPEMRPGFLLFHSVGDYKNVSPPALEADAPLLFALPRLWRFAWAFRTPRIQLMNAWDVPGVVSVCLARPMLSAMLFAFLRTFARPPFQLILQGACRQPFFLCRRDRCHTFRAPGTYAGGPWPSRCSFHRV